MRVEITFSVSGYVRQEVEIIKEGYSIEELENDLNIGTVWTTIQDGGGVIIAENDEVVGRILQNDNDCKYIDFYVKQEDSPCGLALNLDGKVEVFFIDGKPSYAIWKCWQMADHIKLSSYLKERLQAGGWTVYIGEAYGEEYDEIITQITSE